MDHSRLSISDEDIDARLARYEEEGSKEDDSENISQAQLYNKVYKTSEDQYSMSDKNKSMHKEIFKEFSYPGPRFKKRHDNSSFSMRADYEGKQHITTNDKLASTTSKFQDDESEFSVCFKEYPSRQQKRDLENKDSHVGKINANAFPKKYSTPQKNRILTDGSQFTDYPYSSDSHYGNLSHVPLSPSNKNELETSYRLDNCEKSSHYALETYSNDLEENRRLCFNRVSDLKDDDENDKYVSSYRNGAIMKNPVRVSYSHSSTDNSKLSESNMVSFKQNRSSIDFKGKGNGKRFHRSQIVGSNKYVSDYSRYSESNQSQKKRQSSSEINKEQYVLFKEEQSDMRNLNSYNCVNESQISYPYGTHYDQKYKSGLMEESNRINSRYDNAILQNLQYQNLKHSRKYSADFKSDDCSRSPTNSVLNRKHHKNIQNNSGYNSQGASVWDRCMVSKPRNPESENQMKHRYLENKEENNDIWKRQSACNEEIHDTPLNSDLKEIRKSKPNTNTFTMRDARRIAPMVINCPTDETPVSQAVSEIIEEDVFRNKRKCWTRVCWSRTKHSHGLNISADLHSSNNRNAIVNSMKHPQYATKSKKKSFTDCWSSFLKASSSRFELWSRTLKKIEGQFGTGVVSYFVFLRWLIVLNFVIFILYLLLIILPYSAFALLPHQNIKSAPNITLLTDEYLQQFPKYEELPFTRKRIGPENASLNLDVDGDLLSNLGTLLDNFAHDEIVDVTLRYDKRNYTGKERYEISLYCEDKYEKIMANHTKGTFIFLQDFLQGTGWLQSTILFLGFYPDRDVSYFGLSYNLPVSFLAVFIVSFLLSLVLMVQYSSHGIQETVLTHKSNYLTFSNILFCSWDYCIEDKKTAAIRHKSITCEIKSNLAEEHRKSEVSHWSSQKWMKVYALRATINIIVIAALFGSFYLIYRVVNIQLKKQRENALKDAGIYTLFIQFLPPLVITGLNIIMPIIFYNLVKFEMYNTRTQINMALFRIVFLRLASVFVLVSSFYQQITCEPKDVCKAGMSEYCRSPICWETYVGQQLYKLVITDFLVYICMFLAYDLPRDFIVQKCRCKVTEVVGRQVFDIPSQVLSLVYSQTLCWLGLLYSPLLAGITVLKFLIIFYVKKVVVLKHCVPAPVLYKASRSNSIFMTVLMISFFVVTAIHGYSLTSIEPSPGCSPFRQYVVIIYAISDAIDDWSSKLVKFMTYLFSGFFFIPASLLICLVIYYYWTVIAAHKQMTKVLKAQIAVEGRDKQFLLNRLAEAARQATAN